MAQSPDENGTLTVRLFRDLNNNGKVTSAEEVTLLPDCLIWVLHDLTGAVVPTFAVVGSDQLPAVASAPLDGFGQATFQLPAGRYSVVTPNCFIADMRDLEPYVLYRGVPKCCPNTDGSPAIDILTDIDGVGSLEVQIVDVRSGEATIASVRGYPRHETTRGQYLLAVVALSALAIFGLVLVSVWKLRPRYNPVSDPDNPTEFIEPPARSADFDKVFGDFLKKQDD